MNSELFERAEAVSQRAYAPYSKFQVGAAVRARDGTVFDGANVENAAYPLGLCAEKAALAQAIAAGYGPGQLEELAVTASPCGGCRQWLVELGVERIVYRNAAGELVNATPAELLPDAFEL
jgi:cytidine deaminase